MTIGEEQISSDDNIPIYGATGSNEMWSQSIVPGVTRVYVGVSLYMNKVGSPTDNVIVDIRSSHGGASLATVSIAASSIVNLDLNDFLFSAPITLTGGSTYYIEASRSGGRDTVNRVDAYRNTLTDAYTGGICEGRQSGSWSTFNYDLRFRTYIGPQHYVYPLRPRAFSPGIAR